MKYILLVVILSAVHPQMNATQIEPQRDQHEIDVIFENEDKLIADLGLELTADQQLYQEICKNIPQKPLPLWRQWVQTVGTFIVAKYLAIKKLTTQYYECIKRAFIRKKLQHK